MKNFTASNGTTFEIVDGVIRWRSVSGTADHDIRTMHRGSQLADALREFVQAEHDEELGRWRDPERPHMVAYPDHTNTEVWVMNEITGGGNWQSRYSTDVSASTDWIATGKAYFAAHPEPKPWESAKPGEHWMLTAEGMEREYVAIRSLLDIIYLFPVDDVHAPKLGLKAPVITKGRRIYPETDA